MLLLALGTAWYDDDTLHAAMCRLSFWYSCILGLKSISGLMLMKPSGRETRLAYKSHDASVPTVFI